jgi:ATP-dependent Clp protease adaptor protein ClpS
MGDTAVVSKETVKSRIKEPKKFKVLILNDDYTPMDFVIAILVTVFKHPEPSAVKIMLQVHNEGSGVAGVYNYEIAEQKGIETTNLAKENGYPLQIKVEPV